MVVFVEEKMVGGSGGRQGSAVGVFFLCGSKVVSGGVVSGAEVWVRYDI